MACQGARSLATWLSDRSELPGRVRSETPDPASRGRGWQYVNFGSRDQGQGRQASPVLCFPLARSVQGADAVRRGLMVSILVDNCSQETPESASNVNHMERKSHMFCPSWATRKKKQERYKDSRRRKELHRTSLWVVRVAVAPRAQLSLAEDDVAGIRG